MAVQIRFLLFVSLFLTQAAFAAAISLAPGDLVEALPKESMQVLDTHEHRLVTYIGYNTVQALDHRLGREWRQRELILFRATDGFESAIPTAELLHRPSLLSVAREGRREFTVQNLDQGDASVSAGPLYLVWAQDPTQSEQESTYWPYQIISVEPTEYRAQFPNVMPSLLAPKEVRRGAKLFVEYCLTCHQMRGEGGTKGPDLSETNHLASWLKLALAEPSAFRLKGMPPFSPNRPDRDLALDAIVRYLKFMSKSPTP